MVDGRAEAGEQGWRWFSGVHRLLLRLAGRVPDEWLTHARGLLPLEFPSLPSVVCGSVVEFGVPLTVGEVALLREIHSAVFGAPDPVGVDLVEISEETPPSGHRFFPVPGAVLATDGARIPARLDLTGSEDLWDLPPELSELDDLAVRLTDLEDQSLVTVLSRDEDVVSVARAWRFPPDGKPADGVRVALVEVVEPAPAYDITVKAQRILAEDGVTDPQAEVYWTGMDLPPYHQEALAGAALLWRRPA